MSLVSWKTFSCYSVFQTSLALEEWSRLPPSSTPSSDTCTWRSQWDCPLEPAFFVIKSVNKVNLWVVEARSLLLRNGIRDQNLGSWCTHCPWGTFHSSPKEGQCKKMFKVPHSCTYFICYKLMLKILQAMLQWYVTREFADLQDGFRKSRGTRDQIANACWIIEKTREFQKNLYFCYIQYGKAFDYVDHNKLENS